MYDFVHAEKGCSIAGDGGNISPEKQSGGSSSKIGVSAGLKEMACNISTGWYVCRSTEFQLCLF